MMQCDFADSFLLIGCSSFLNLNIESATVAMYLLHQFLG